MQVDGGWAAHSAFVVASRDIQPRVQAVFDSPMGSVFLKPADGVESLGREAGDERHRLGLAALDFAPQSGTLPGEGEACLLRADRGALYYPCFLSAFVSLPGSGERFADGAGFAGTGAFLSGCGWARGKNPQAVGRCGFRCFFSHWLGFL